MLLFVMFLQYEVPAHDTTYLCQAFKLTKMDRRHHLVKVCIIDNVYPFSPFFMPTWACTTSSIGLAIAL